MLYKLTWEQFKETIVDDKGIRIKFENLCRQLFVNEYLSKNKKIKTVHSNPNNPGIEAEPVYDESNNRWIGFQAKFFEDKISYNQISHSIEKAVEYYGNKIDYIVLYSNKPLSMKAKKYIEIKNLLDSKNITLEIITDESILDLVRRYEYLAKYYFGVHLISFEWINNHNHDMFNGLGERFNNNFNVETEQALQLSLFVNDEVAINYINKKKSDLILKIQTLYSSCSEYHKYLSTMENFVKNIDDIDNENIKDSFYWKQNIEELIREEKENINLKKCNLEKEISKLIANNLKENDESRYEYKMISKELDNLDVLLKLPRMLAISEEEQNLILGKVLFVTGKAGVGKSQLFANKVSFMNKNKENAILFLAGMYFTDEKIDKQIMANSNLNYSFDEFIEILETMGKLSGKIIPIFIDALNETWNNHLWKKDLPLIVNKIEKCNYLKLACSFRIEYEDSLIDESLKAKITNQCICRIIHRGFEQNNIEAAKQFFYYYKIPFTLYEFFEQEITNPLFLTLYCQTYDGGEVNLSTLYEKLILKANENINKAMIISLRNKGYSGNENLLDDFIEELVSVFVKNKKKFITKKDLMKLDYWKLFDISAPPFIDKIKKEHIMHSIFYKQEEIFYFSYDQMNDYFCAKNIISKIQSKIDIKEKIFDLLSIKNNKINNNGNIDLVIWISAFYAKKFKEECIDFIEELNEEDKSKIIYEYIKSFQWRDKNTISDRLFLNLINKYSVEKSLLWEVLIRNSIKVRHPLNADFLHNFLMKYKLNKRDYIWTIYINSIFENKDNRITQLVKMYNQGIYINMKDKKQTELLLTLFGWLLTSSDRLLRDYTSKAMIEILKINFDLCEIILRKFENVNDPYIIERLYGIVFGAYCKCNKKNDKEVKMLSEYVYKTVFDKERVYPDILLRDYARLIIEKFLFEAVNYKGIINKNKIIPPYNSDMIPNVEEDYSKKENYGYGLYEIAMSMKFENMGLYGDFGRYVFQSALYNFDVDLKQIYNYAISFIINELEYKEEFFGEFDSRRYYRSRHLQRKIERIGKKYQWIAMYNIMARVTDNYSIKNSYEIGLFNNKFEGAWDPCVRNFDPTLNVNFMRCKDVPVFKQESDFLVKSKKEIESEEYQLKNKNFFFEHLINNIILVDDNNSEWVRLTSFFDINAIKTEKNSIWAYLYAFFVTSEQEKMFANMMRERKDLRKSDLMNFNQIYNIFNREYPWSPSCNLVKDGEWIELAFKINEAGNKDNKFEKILRATNNLLWAEEYDASKDEAISWNVPCTELVEFLKLKQMENDGFYYDENGKLAAFDTKVIQAYGGVVIRRDLLDIFLSKKKKKLIWILNSNKEIRNEKMSLLSWEEWTGLFLYNKSIEGDIYKLKEKNN